MIWLLAAVMGGLIIALFATKGTKPSPPSQ
jgi:hypothetical protein